jgi:hypothetical protein
VTRKATADEKALARQLAEAIRQAVIDAALDAYEQASISGLHHDGAWEAAVGAMRRVALDALAPPGLDENLRVHLRRGK